MEGSWSGRRANGQVVYILGVDGGIGRMCASGYGESAELCILVVHNDIW